MLAMFYGWAVVAVCTIAKCFQSLGASSVFAFSVPAMLLDTRLGLTRSELSGAYSAGGLVGAFASPFLGVAADRWGSRICLPVAFVATALSLLLLSTATSVTVLFMGFLGARVFAIGGVSLWANVPSPLTPNTHTHTPPPPPPSQHPPSVNAPALRAGSHQPLVRAETGARDGG